jgi:hypothetical protein
MTGDEMIKGLRYKAANIKAHMEPEFFAEVADYLESQKWVPISKEMSDEKLPEDFQRVLITITNYYGDKVVRVAEYHKLGKRFQVKENTNEWIVGETGLLAWMPLPEPYKAESEDET